MRQWQVDRRPSASLRYIICWLLHLNCSSSMAELIIHYRTYSPTSKKPRSNIRIIKFWIFSSDSNRQATNLCYEVILIRNRVSLESTSCRTRRPLALLCLAELIVLMSLQMLAVTVTAVNREDTKTAIKCLPKHLFSARRVVSIVLQFNGIRASHHSTLLCVSS